MYGQSPYGNIMGRGMFMQPQMQQMLQMRDQMRNPQAMPSQQFQTQGPESFPIDATNGQIGYQEQPMPAQLPSDPSLGNISEPFRQIQPQEMSTEDSLMQVQQALTNMQQQQQQLSQHLGAGSGMLQQQGGLGGLYQGRLRNLPVQHQMITAGPGSLRLRTQGPQRYQGNPFGA